VRHLLSLFCLVLHALTYSLLDRELTKLHEQLFHRASRLSLRITLPTLLTPSSAGEPLVASVWRRQTFSAAVDSLDPEMSLSLFREHMAHVFSLINPDPSTIAPELEAVLDASYLYSRMLHKSYSPGGALEGSGFYRSFVCQVGAPLDPTQLGASSLSLPLSPALLCARAADADLLKPRRAQSSSRSATGLSEVRRRFPLFDLLCVHERADLAVDAVAQVNPSGSARACSRASSRRRPSTRRPFRKSPSGTASPASRRHRLRSARRGRSSCVGPRSSASASRRPALALAVGLPSLPRLTRSCCSACRCALAAHGVSTHARTTASPVPNGSVGASSNAHSLP